MNVFTLLGVLFVVLKLAGVTQVAGWSWWIVLLPFYGGAALWLLFVGIMVAFAAVLDR